MKRKITLLEIKNILIVALLFGGFGLQAQNWTQVGNDIIDTTTFVNGFSVDISKDGNTIAYSDPEFDNYKGLVTISTFDGTNWILKGSPILGAIAQTSYGWDVSFANNGNTISIGMPSINYDGQVMGSGLVNTYDFINSDWVLRSTLNASQSNSGFGKTIELSSDGNTLIVGAFDYGNSDVGKVFVNQWDSIINDWVLKGTPIAGVSTNSLTGLNVSISDNGDIIAISSKGNFAKGNNKIYNFDGTDWVQKGTDIIGDNNGDYFGKNGLQLSANGNKIAISSENDKYCKVFEYNGTDWIQLGLTLIESANNSNFGQSIDISDDGNYLIVGDNQVQINSVDYGKTKLFYWNEISWTLKDSINGNSYYDYGFDVAISANGSTIISSTSRFEYLSNQIGKIQIFTANNSASFSQSSCSSYTNIEGDVFTQSDIYTYNTSNSLGFDSTITLDLTINEVNVSTSQNGNTINAVELTATYQWLNCNKSIIAGETTNEYTPTENGDYAVEITKNGCIDTSECISITNVAINNFSELDKISIYPNPTKDVININLKNLEKASIEITDIQGRMFFSKEDVSQKNISINMRNNKGIYFITITTNGISKQFKISKI